MAKPKLSDEEKLEILKKERRKAQIRASQERGRAKLAESGIQQTSIAIHKDLIDLLNEAAVAAKNDPNDPFERTNRNAVIEEIFRRHFAEKIMREAFDEKDAEMLQRAIQLGLNVSRKYVLPAYGAEFAYRPIERAAEQYWVDGLKLLIAAGAKVEDRDIEITGKTNSNPAIEESRAILEAAKLRQEAEAMAAKPKRKRKI